MTTNRDNSTASKEISAKSSTKLFRKLIASCLAAALSLPAIGFHLLTSSPAMAKEPNKLSETEEKLIREAAKNRNLEPEDLELLTSSTLKLPLTKGSLPAAKLLNRKTDEVFTIALDENDRETDPKGLRQEEVLARSAKYGKLDPFLYDRTRAMRAGDLVKVGMWLKLKQNLDELDVRTGDEERLKPEEIEAIIAERKQVLQKAAEQAIRPVRSFLGKKKFIALEYSLTSPFVYAMVPVKALNTLSLREDVVGIFAADRVVGDYLGTANRTIRADVARSTFGLSGNGVNVAIVEDSRVDFDNTCLANNLGTRVPGHSNVDQHATACAGIVASTNSTVSGIAPGAGIYSANGTSYSDGNMSAAMDAAAANAHIQNNSWGPQCGSANSSIDMEAIHADYIVRFGWDTVVAAAGNNGNCGDGRFVDGVAGGYNVIAVGNFDDGGTDSHSDDAMNTSSSYDDPDSDHGDRQKPEVAAPGTSITSLTTTSGSCATTNVGSGTSFAAPMVAGLAALLMERRSSLKIWPEAVKAIVMAGATHNIEGSSRLSDKDGAGGIDALSSVRIADAGNFRTKVLREDDFDGSGNFEINIGRIAPLTRVRVVIAWDSNPQTFLGLYLFDNLDADLDLRVVGPGVSASSASWDNSYEIVDFVTPFSILPGDFKIRVKNFRFDGSKEYLGVAWSKTSIRGEILEVAP